VVAAGLIGELRASEGGAEPEGDDRDEFAPVLQALLSGVPEYDPRPSDGRFSLVGVGDVRQLAPDENDEQRGAGEGEPERRSDA